jgi:hypothetical protein
MNPSVKRRMPACCVRCRRRVACGAGPFLPAYVGELEQPHEQHGLVGCGLRQHLRHVPVSTLIPVFRPAVPPSASTSSTPTSAAGCGSICDRAARAHRQGGAGAESERTRLAPPKQAVTPGRGRAHPPTNVRRHRRRRRLSRRSKNGYGTEHGAGYAKRSWPPCFENAYAFERKHTRTHTRARMRTQRRKHARTHARTHAQRRKHARTHARTHAHKHKHKQTHT